MHKCHSIQGRESRDRGGHLPSYTIWRMDIGFHLADEPKRLDGLWKHMEVFSHMEAFSKTQYPKADTKQLAKASTPEAGTKQLAKLSTPEQPIITG